MATVQPCSVCGAPVVSRVGGPFAEAPVAAPLCPACTEPLFLDQGGAVLTLRQDLPGARFALGKVTVTAGALAALAEAGQHAVAFLERHVRGDWGAVGHCDAVQLTEDERRRGWEATDDSARINLWNLLRGKDTLLSEYVTDRGQRLWIVTCLDRGGGTTVLLPQEY
jgi:hypothetical protein